MDRYLPVLAYSGIGLGGERTGMTIVKPMRLGHIGRAQREPPRTYYFVTALGYFDLLNPSDFDLDTNMWPTAAAELGATPLDVGMPKPRGEVVVVGEAAPAGGRSVTQMVVEVAVGAMRKQLMVSGDRHWELTQDGAALSAPLPFVRMPLTWDRAFGGPAFAANPTGVGHAARAALAGGRPMRLPNIEDPADLILHPDQTPRPAGFAPLDVMSPARQRHVGTYDDNWLRRHHPGHAPDFDWAFYNTAASDQWMPGFLSGDERIRITGMHPEHPAIDSRMPGMRVRAFLNLVDSGGRRLAEVDMRCETLALFASRLKAVAIYRGGCEVTDIDGKDVVDTLLAYERLGDPPRPAEHYAATLKARTDPETAALSFFDEKPLRPDITEVELAERQAERAAVVADRDEMWERRMAAMIGRAYKVVGAPAPSPDALPRSPLPVDIPVITASDIERMDVDLVGIAAAMAKLRAYGDEQISAARQQAAGMLGELTAGAGGMLDPGSLVKLRNAASSIGDADGAAPSAQLGGMPTLTTLREEMAVEGMAGTPDPFADIVAALQAIDVPAGSLSESERALLRARSQGLAEGRFGADALAVADGIDQTAGGMDGAPVSADAEPASRSVEAFLKEVGLAGPARTVSEMLDGLGPQAGLVTPLLAAQPPRPPAAAGDPTATAKEALAEAGAELEAAFVGARRVSPEPMAPIEPLRAEAARYLGDSIQECLAAGGDFTGRDWAGAELAGVSFAGLDLRGTMFERANLAGADFHGAMLENTVFTGATLTGADLSECVLRGANLSGVVASGARFVSSNFGDIRVFGANFAGADLSGTVMEDAFLLNVDLSGALLARARMAKTTLVASTLDNAALDHAQFVRCVFMQVAMKRLSARGATFSRCALVNCEQRDSDFSAADFSGSGCVGGAVFDGSIMRRLVGPGSGWRGASMVGVDLRAARLEGADLGEANLTGALLTRASLRQAIMTETVLVKVDATAASFAEATLRRADLRGASLRHANLYRAAVDEADLYNCDLTGANTIGTTLTRARDVAG